MKGWKTIVWNALAAAALIAIYRDEIVPPEARMQVLTYHVLIFGAGNVGLRHVTDSPPAWRRKKP